MESTNASTSSPPPPAPSPSPFDESDFDFSSDPVSGPGLQLEIDSVDAPEFSSRIEGNSIVFSLSEACVSDIGRQFDGMFDRIPFCLNCDSVYDSKLLLERQVKDVEDAAKATLTENRTLKGLLQQSQLREEEQTREIASLKEELELAKKQLEAQVPPPPPSTPSAWLPPPSASSTSDFSQNGHGQEIPHGIDNRRSFELGFFCICGLSFSRECHLYQHLKKVIISRELSCNSDGGTHPPHLFQNVLVCCLCEGRFNSWPMFKCHTATLHGITDLEVFDTREVIQHVISRLSCCRVCNQNHTPQDLLPSLIQYYPSR